MTHAEDVKQSNDNFQLREDIEALASHPKSDRGEWYKIIFGAYPQKLIVVYELVFAKLLGWKDGCDDV